MSISRSLGSQSIQRPGAYSQTVVSNNGGVPLLNTGTLFLVGEASSGQPGSIQGYQSFSSAEFSALVAQYVSGPLVDAAKAALIPSSTPSIGSWSNVVVYKTNHTTAAALALDNSSSAALINVSALNWGVLGNGLQVAVAAGTAPTLQSSITVSSTALTESLGQNPALAQIQIQYIGSGSASTATISGASLSAKVLTTACAGATADNLSIALNGLTVQQLVTTILSAKPGKYAVTLTNVLTGTITPATDLDSITAVDIMTAAVSLYRIQQELVTLINTSRQVSAKLATTPVAGNLAVLAASYLTGGTLGSSTNSDFATGINGSLSQTYNIAVPCISQDATADIALGVTDPASTYTIASVAAALNSHLILRGAVKSRKEAQGMYGFRTTTKAAAYTQAQTMNSYLMQQLIQDVLVVDAVSGSLTWKQPHVQAAMAAGIRLGQDVGTPLTHKFLNCSGIGQAVNPTTGLAAGDFDPNTDYDPAITAGVTFAENSGGAFRIVVDNTTYGIDESFVFNRGSVVQAAQYIAQNLRNVAETLFVGNKVSNGIAASMKSALKQELALLLTAQITTGTDQYPLGYDPKTFTVIVDGDTATVNLLVIPTQGLDFVLIQLNLGDIQQSA